MIFPVSNSFIPAVIFVISDVLVKCGILLVILFIASLNKFLLCVLIVFSLSNLVIIAAAICSKVLLSI
ncbi:MAG: hypothetical protein ACIPMY_01860 [Rickettsia endosymbiont of Pentastiridius leporinus]